MSSLLWGIPPKLFKIPEEREKMTLKNIKHGRTYSSCEFYPDGDESYEPGYIKVSVETRDVIEQRESGYPVWHGRYAHYAKREILNLRAEGKRCKERTVEWIKDAFSDF